MSIFPGQVPTTIDVVVSRIKNLNSQLYRNTVLQHKLIFNTIWKNVDFTPQQICDGFGTDTAALFQLSNDLQTTFKTANPEYEVLNPPNAVTINTDGTVTIGALINSQ